VNPVILEEREPRYRASPSQPLWTR
jgi:hypothetical protein